MKIAIAGGLGFIGASATAKALKNGHDVDILTNTLFESLHYEENSKLKIHVRSQSQGQHAWGESLRTSDAVIIATGGGGPSRAMSDPTQEATVNLLPVLRLIHECVEKRVKRIVLISSAGTVYGDTDIRQAEEHWSLNPSGLYGATKAALEMYSMAICSKSLSKLLIVRLSNPYGPLQFPGQGQGLIANAIEAVETNNTFQIWGDGKETRDYIYIEDVAKALVKLSLSNLEGTLNISSGKSTSTTEVLMLIGKLTKQEIISEKVIQSLDLPKAISISNSKVLGLTDWRPGTSLESGIDATLRWMRDSYAQAKMPTDVISPSQLRWQFLRETALQAANRNS